MKINSGYQRYRIIPRELQFGYGYTCDGLRCVRVWVRYGKIPPAVYPCSTLTYGWNLQLRPTMLCISLGTGAHWMSNINSWEHSIEPQAYCMIRQSCNKPSIRLIIAENGCQMWKIYNDVRDGVSCVSLQSCRVLAYSDRCMMSDALYRAWWRRIEVLHKHVQGAYHAHLWSILIFWSDYQSRPSVILGL